MDVKIRQKNRTNVHKQREKMKAYSVVQGTYDVRRMNE
jgi:hypothetical protein